MPGIVCTCFGLLDFMNYLLLLSALAFFLAILEPSSSFPFVILYTKKHRIALTMNKIYRQRSCHAVVSALQMTVQEHDQSHGCTIRISLSVCEDLGHIEHLQTADYGSDQCICQDRTYQRQSNIEKPLETGTPRQARRPQKYPD